MSDGRLVADVGGTNVRFALLTPGGELDQVREYRVEEFASFKIALETYRNSLKGTNKIGGCKIAAAGPVRNGFVKLTNSPWTIYCKDVEEILDGAPVTLINDLEAVAAALPYLKTEDLEPIGRPMPIRPETRTMLALNVGTGFGGASVAKHDATWWTSSGEPGHIRLGAASDREFDLLQKGASVESVLSGSGVVALYNRLAKKDGLPVGEIQSAERVFSRVDSDKAAAAATDMFTSILGRVSGDLVLASGAWGGVYLSGSVALGWLAVVNSASFRSEFELRGPLRALMEGVPTAIIRHKNAGLFGLSVLYTD